MNKLTKRISKVMQPAAALIAYTCEGEYGGMDYFLEVRKIGKSGLMEAGKPVSMKFIQSLVESFTVESSTTPHGVIPKRLLFVNTQAAKYVWHTPQCRKYLYFNNNLNIPNGEYCIPGLIWVVNKELLSLFAYKSKRLTSGTQLFSAPFFNVNPKDGNVCLGNAGVLNSENNGFEHLIQSWEDRFFLSEFSHVLGKNPTKSNLVLVTQNSIQAFDNDELLPIKKMKLKNLLK